MKILLIATLLIGMTACRDPNGYPRIDDQEQLSPNFHYVVIDGVEYIDTEKSFCLSRIYRYSKGYIGPIKNSIKLPIHECNRVIGKAPAEYAVFFNWLDGFRLWLLDMI